MEKANHLTRLASHTEIEKLLRISIKASLSDATYLCDGHYCRLHKEINPQNYQNKCATCGLVIRAATSIRHCPNPEYIQKHLQGHAGFEGEISAVDRVCEACYRAHLTLLKTEDDADNEDFDATRLIN